MVKNILFVHQSAELYGSDKVLLLLCAELVKGGKYWPIVLLPETGPLLDALQQHGVEVHVGEVSKISRAVFSPVGVVKLLFSIFHGCRHINALLAGRRVEVVHSNTLAVLTGAVWAFLRRKKHIWHVHEIILSPRIVSRVFPWLVNLFSDLAMSNSSLTEKWLLTEQPKLKSRSVVVFNGLPPVEAPSSADITAFRTLIEAEESDTVISLVGRINNWKGQALLLESLALLQQKGLLTSVKVAIVGETVAGKEFLLEELKQKVNLLGLQEVVRFVPFLNDVWPVWFATNIAVVPSTEPEPFGMVAIEAMAAGLPVVAARHGGLLDIVVDGSTGLLFTPNDALALSNALMALIASPELGHKLGEAGMIRQHEHFSLQAQVEQTVAAYERVRA